MKKQCTKNYTSLGLPSFASISGGIVSGLSGVIGSVYAKDEWMKHLPVIAVIAMAALIAAGMMALSPASQTDRIVISYEPPKVASHQRIRDELKARRALEKLQKFLSPFRLPSALHFTLAGCDGEADAFYGDGKITICYEYIAELWENMPSQKTPAGVEQIDTVVGPFVDTSLHEFAHALFDMLDIPLFGREETAADLLGAYIYLQLGDDEARRLITGTAYAYLTEARDDMLQSPELKEFSGEHDTPAQRMYNVLCIAYGADPNYFGDFVTKGFLPKERARFCEEEYDQVGKAFDRLIEPHIDLDMADDILDRSWLRKTDGKETLLDASEPQNQGH